MMKKFKSISNIFFIVLLVFISLPVFINLIIKPGELPSYRHIEDVLSYSAEDLLEEYDLLYDLAAEFLELYEESGYGDSLHPDDSSDVILDPNYLEDKKYNASLKPYHVITNPDGYKNDLERIGNLISYLSYKWDSGFFGFLSQKVNYIPQYILFTFKFILHFIYTVVSTFFTIFSIPYRITNF